MKSRPNGSVGAVWEALCATRAEVGLDVRDITPGDVEEIAAGLKLAPSVEKLCAGIRASATHVDDRWKGGGSWRENFNAVVLMRPNNIERMLAWADEEGPRAPTMGGSDARAKRGERHLIDGETTCHCRIGRDHTGEELRT